ncbi:MAG: molybdopterin-dependent oxidoreductase [Treponema sp.]|nr:molybdopterin-dependent oxidoreductase [Treponema sp.]
MFVEDISVRGMLHALTIRSPSARGHLVSIETPKFPGSYTLITAAQIPGKNQLEDFSVPILASDTVSYIGEPVALLVGPEEAKLEDYAGRCTVVVREEAPDFSGKALSEESIAKKREYTEGDLEALFSGAESVVKGVYTTAIQEHWYSEPHGAVAVFGNGKISIHTATQWPFHVKRSAAKVLKMDPSAVDVDPAQIGVHLDGKLWYPSLISCHAALGAFITRKPVKLMLTREEDYCYSPKRNKTEIHIRSALGSKGEILGTGIRVTAETGAQNVFAGEILDHTCLGCLGIYRLGKIDLQGIAVKTNIPPQGPLGGFGLSQGFFAIERHVSRIADSLGEDPAEWRKKNCLAKNNSLAIGIPLKNQAPVTELIDTAAAMSDYYRRWASYELLRRNRKGKEWDINSEPLRGMGIAAAYQGSGLLYSGSDKGAYSVELTLEKDGALEIKTSIASAGVENIRIWRTFASEILSVNAAQVRVQCGTGAPDSGPGCLSRNISVITRLVEKCCQAIRKQRFRDPLPITVRRSVRPGKITPWGRENGEKPADPNAFARPGWGAAAVEIEIDTISLVPRIRGIWIAVDGGRIHSQARARHSLKTSVIQALDWCSREALDYDQGRISRGFLGGYTISGPMEIPPIHIDFLWNDNSPPKGIGELPFSCIPAAYVQAVSQAMDYPFEKLPVTAQDVWEAAQLKKTGEGA